MDLIFHLCQKLFLVLLALFFNVFLLVMFRLLGKVPSELDRVGSDLTLYGYGIGLSFLLSTQTGHPALQWLQPAQMTLLVTTALVTNLFLYTLNLYLSKSIRDIDRDKYVDGLELAHLKEVLASIRGRRLFAWSLAIGFIPTIVLVSLDFAER